jgi:cytochrome P450
MSYLQQYDAAATDREKVSLVNRWLRTDWRPFFAELRQDRPVFVTPAYTLVARFDDVTEVLSRERIFSVGLYAPRMDPVVDGPFMLSRDDTATNWREKGLMQAMLRPEDLPRVRRLARRFAEDSLDRAAPTGRLEAVSRLGRYVPTRMCIDYFGFPGPDLATMYRWSKATQWDMFKNLQNDPVVHAASVRAGEEMLDHLHEQLAKRRTGRHDGPGENDVFDRLLATRLPTELGVDDHRRVANVAGLLIGAVETTSQAIVQVIEQLLQRPEIREQAVAAAAEPDPARFDAYVWEALRFNPINPLLFRRCESDYTVAAGTPRQTRIPAGTVVFALTASAMFDEAVVPDPDVFRTDRPDFARLHFGYGHHTCLGRHVAAVTIPETVRRVLRRPGIRLLPPPDGGIDFAGGPFPERFVVAFDAVPHPTGAEHDGARPHRPAMDETAMDQTAMEQVAR